MAFEIPLDDIDPENVGGFDRPCAGNYHMLVHRVQEDGGKKGEMIVDYEVQSGTPAGQEGKIHQDYFTKTSKAAKRLVLFAIAAGITTIDYLRECKESGKEANIDFMAAQGKHLFVELFEEEYDGKKRIKAGFGLFAMDDPRCKEWPRNDGVLKKSAEPEDDPFGSVT